ncbi:MAG: class I SAM-dependent methyltransferase, partial [Firmicutes bacterium]|nr:class I SAM-dependent methyltransferase [Bacillota bacterium]
VHPLMLEAEDQANRSSLQLYYHVCQSVNLHGQDVLEVGCGRGGGASFMKRYLQPHSLTGIDYSEKAIEFCQQHYQITGLHYQVGDAENLPCQDSQFDTVINVESSHCYGRMDRFLAEVWRVLKPGGQLLWADHRQATRLQELKATILGAGFELVEETVITSSVLNAMKFQGAYNKALIDAHVPKIARQIFYHFSGLEGTHIYNQFVSGKLVYLKMVMRKRDH